MPMHVIGEVLELVKYMLLSGPQKGFTVIHNLAFDLNTQHKAVTGRLLHLESY